MKGETNSNMQGLVSVSFRKHSPREICEAARAAGLSCIEWGSDVHAPSGDTERLLTIRALDEEYGLICSSYGTYFRLGETPLSELLQYIRGAKILGTNVLRLWCGTKSGDAMTASERLELFRTAKRAAEIAKAEGVILAMECHRKTFTEHLSDALDLLRAVDSPHFRMYWQPFQWKDVSENLAYAREIAPYTVHLHVFQWKGKERFSLNEGVEEWRNYLAAFPAPRVLLLEFMPNDGIDELLREAEALRRIVKAEETV